MKYFKTQKVVLVISLVALGISFFTFWYNFLREGEPIFTSSRWTAIGISNSGQEGSAFAVNISVNNDGNAPLELIDFMMVAETHNKKKIFYDPIILFDLTHYISSLGEDGRMGKTQRGQVPLPMIVPPNQQYTFEKEILFMPYDKTTSIINNIDAPFTLKLYALTNRTNSYKKIAEQYFRPEDIQNLVNGSFSGVLSSSSIRKRKEFINKLK